MILGAQLYTVRDFITNPKDIKESINKIAKIGYKTVQLSALGKIDPIELNNITKEAGIQIIGTHITSDRIINQTKEVIKEYNLYNCPTVGIGGLPAEYGKSLDGYREFIKLITPAVNELRANGIEFTYHNHAFEFQRFGKNNGFEILVQETDWLFTLDTYWVQVAGKNPIDIIHLLKNRIKLIHFKDLTLNWQEQRMAAVYEGNLNFDGIIAVCKNTNVQWAVVEQDETYGKCPFEELKISYENLIDKV